MLAILLVILWVFYPHSVVSFWMIFGPPVESECVIVTLLALVSAVRAAAVVVMVEETVDWSQKKCYLLLLHANLM